MSSKGNKLSDLLICVRRSVALGHYRDTFHSSGRYGERRITRPEILDILRYGWHEKRKDRFDEQHHTWNYSIRGETMDGRHLRVVVTFEGELLIIVTAIDLDEK